MYSTTVATDITIHIPDISQANTIALVLMSTLITETAEISSTVATVADAVCCQ
jgi:hypothetical protein